MNKLMAQTLVWKILKSIKKRVLNETLTKLSRSKYVLYSGEAEVLELRFRSMVQKINLATMENEFVREDILRRKTS